MTGYGRAVETVNGREFTVELRSVNNRYLDCTVKLPRSVSFAEEAVKQALMVELAEYKELAKGNKSKREGFKKAAIESIKKDLAKLDDQEDKLYTFLEDGTYTKDVFLKRKALLEENRGRLNKLLEEAEKTAEDNKSYKDAVVKLSEAIKTIKNKNLSVTAKNKLLSEIIEDIIYSRKVPENRRKFRDVPFKLQIKLKI